MTENLLVLATDGGVSLAKGELNGRQDGAHALADRTVTAVMMREGVILAGTTDGVFRSDDEGQTWHEASAGLTIRHVRWLAFHPNRSDLELAGTEPAGIFVSHDGARTWRGCPEVEALRDEHRWFLPYSPEAGCVRDFALHGDRVYAAVEVGGVLRSDDGGETWQLADGSTGDPVFDIPPAPLVHADVHSVIVHPSSPDLLFAATAEGLYRSDDGGATWSVTHRGSYCRAVWADPADPSHLILGPADSVQRKNGRVEETRDAGHTWTLATEGLDMPWPDTMVERFAQMGDELLAITNDGKIYSSSLPNLRWHRILSDAGRVNAAAHS